MARNNHINSRLIKIEEDLKEPPYPVLAFDVILDDPAMFDPYCWDSAEQAGHFWEEGMPNKDGFFYLTDEYEAYLAVLFETGKQHPANTDQKLWTLYVPEPIR